MSALAHYYHMQLPRTAQTNLFVLLVHHHTLHLFCYTDHIARTYTIAFVIMSFLSPYHMQFDYCMLTLSTPSWIYLSYNYAVL